MDRQQKIQMAATAVKNGIGPEALRTMLKLGLVVVETVTTMFNSNMEVLDELFPEDGSVEHEN